MGNPTKENSHCADSSSTAASLSPSPLPSASLPNKNLESNNNHRKRPFQPQDETHTPSRQKTIETNNETIQSLKLEAIFHPKFENEKQNDQQIRTDMIDRVSNRQGTLEVTLKHSGSLILWSGGQRYYSKNAVDNVHTAVGEVLLRQHFSRAWLMEDAMNRFKTDDKMATSTVATTATQTATATDGNEDKIVLDLTIQNDHGNGCDDLHEMKYLECSDYIQQHRLTLSFELVTSVLGHHGDIPKRDYMVLIAIADRTTGKFYTTTEVIELAQRFRLPHNDTWIFQSKESTLHLFELYDSMRETGLASTVIQTLSKYADGGHVKSMNPHEVFQGQILEGIVIRYVGLPQSKRKLDSDAKMETDVSSSSCDMDQHCAIMSKLCKQSESILNAVPPEKRLLIKSNQDSGSILLLKTDVRELFEKNDSATFASILSQICQKSNISCDEKSDKEMNRRIIKKVNKKDANIDIPTIVSKIIENGNMDEETRRIATLIQTIENLELSADYNIIREVHENPLTSDIIERYLCIIHIHRDSCFQKYHVATRMTDSMPLYRGFSIELCSTESARKQPPHQSLGLLTKLDLVRLTSSDNTCHSDDGPLMLKMKFLPYMVRTFICRNGLSTLTKNGIHRFNKYAFEQLTKWNISKDMIAKYLDFFHGWAKYCESPSQKNSDGDILSPLNSSNYLHHYYHFESLYSCGHFKLKDTKESFRGLVVVVCLEKKKVKNFAHKLSDAIGCSRMLTDVNVMSNLDMARAIQKKGGGILCITEVTEGVKGLRVLAKGFEKYVSIVMVGCTKDEIESSYVLNGNPNSKEMKKTIGMTNSWKKTKCAVIMELSNSYETFFQFDTDEALLSLVRKLKECSDSVAPDCRPGILTFFPSIPGFGKSAICNGTTTSALNLQNDRKVILRVGDQVTEKFYPLVLKEKLQQPSTIYIADKNATPTSWSVIGNICSQTQGVAVCVVPDSSALQTTTIESRLNDEGEQYVMKHDYPFSLHLLAVCMSRVLNRQSHTHCGKLDSGTEQACMIVVKFYCLYRNITAASLIEKISILGRATNKFINIPFFKEDTNPLDPLPNDLDRLLRRAIEIQTRQDLSDAESSQELKNIEQNLRSSLKDHQSFLTNLQADESYSRKSFIEQLALYSSSLGDSLQERESTVTLSTVNKPAKIKIVSLDISKKKIHSMLENASNTSIDLRNFMKDKGFQKRRNIESVKYKQDCFIQKTHCTFAHKSKMSQEQMRVKFGHLINVTCEIHLLSFHFDDRVAAVEVSVPPSLPRTVNDFSHITIWCAKGVNAEESNFLPTRLKDGIAKCVSFQSPMAIEGTFSYW